MAIYRIEEKYLRMMYGNGLVSRIYKELLELNNTTANDTMKEWARDVNRHHSKAHGKMLNICSH